MLRRFQPILALLLAALYLAPVVAYAQYGEPPKSNEGIKGEEAGSSKKDKDGKRRAPPVDQITGKRLNEAVEQLNAGKLEEARATLGKLDQAKLSPYELSRVLQLLAAIEQSQEHYGAARDQLNKALASGGLNDQEVSAAKFQIAQLFMVEEKWRDGIKALDEWFKIAPEPNSAAYYLLAVAYYQLEDMAKAVEPAQKAVDMAGEKPQDSWLELLLALRMEREEYALAAPLLRKLIALHPDKKQYWVQLSQVYAAQGDMRQASIPLQLAYHIGLITEQNELRRLSELLIQASIPHRAARTLSTAIDKKAFQPDVRTLELLASAWIASRAYEQAVPALEQAAKDSGRSDLYLRLAEVYAQREDWPKATQRLQTALDKGDLKNPGSAQLLMGIVLYSQEKYPDAKVWFERARNSAAQRSQAENWLKYLEQARARQAQTRERAS